MKTIMVVAILFICALTVTAQTNHPRTTSASKQANRSSEAAKKTEESPIACNMNALTAAEREKLGTLVPLMRQLRSGMSELRNGYEFQFPSDKKTLDLVVEMSDLYRRCCSFSELTIRFGKDGGPMFLSFTGGKGAKEFFREDLATLMK